MMKVSRRRKDSASTAGAAAHIKQEVRERAKFILSFKEQQIKRTQEITESAAQVRT